MRVKVFLIQKGCQEESEKYNDKSSSSESKHIEDPIIGASKLSVYIRESYHMHNHLDGRSYPEDSSMYTIEDDEKDEVEEREEKHGELGYELIWKGMSFSIRILYR